MPIGGPTGGGQAGFGSSGSFTGPAEAIEVIGNHMYATSGAVNFDDNETTCVKATTGNYYSYAYVQIGISEVSSDNVFLRIYMNDSLVFLHTVGDTQKIDRVTPIRIVIPSYTEFKVTITNQDDTVRSATVITTGSIYREHPGL